MQAPSDLPLDPAFLAQKLQVKKPVLPIGLALPLVKWRLHRRFHRQISLDLSDFLDFYGKQLRSWSRESVDALKKAFESAADIYRIQLQKGEIRITQIPRQTSADLDRLKANL
jgi:hypothetical protein